MSGHCRCQIGLRRSCSFARNAKGNGRPDRRMRRGILLRRVGSMSSIAPAKPRGGRTMAVVRPRACPVSVAVVAVCTCSISAAAVTIAAAAATAATLGVGGRGID